jgi:hypothetical protein
VALQFSSLLLLQIRFEIIVIYDILETFGRVVSSNRNSKILELVMIGVLLSVVVAVAMLCYLNFDPFWFVLPETENQLITTVLLFMRFLGFSNAACMGWAVLATIFMVLIFGLKIIQETLKCQIRWASRIRNGTPMRNVVNCYLVYLRNRKQSGKRTIPSITPMQRILAIQRQVRILIFESNEAFYLLLPVLLLTGECILVVCSYASIRMHENIPMPFYLVLPGITIFVVMLTMVLFPAASDVYENSSEFLRTVKLIAGRNRYWRRVWHAEKVVKFSMGGLFFAKRSTKTTYLVQCIDATINALLVT